MSDETWKLETEPRQDVRHCGSDVMRNYDISNALT